MLITSVLRVGAVALTLSLCSCDAGPDEANATPPGTVATSTAALNADPTFHESVRALTAKTPGSIERSAGPNPGSTLLTIHHGNAEVVVGTVNADGSTTKRCVSSPAEADAPVAAAPKRADR